MDARISTLESDVAAIRAYVETVHATYATNHLLVAAEGRLELKIEKSKNELNLKIDQVAADLRLDIKTLSVELRTWFLGTVIGLFVAFGSMTVAMYNVLKP